MAAEDHERIGDSSVHQSENIKVAVRLRPFTEKEKQRNNRRIVDIEQKTVVLYNPKGDYVLKKFTFDYSYWSHDGYKRDSNGLNVPDPTHPNHDKYVSQEEVFEDLGQFLLVNTLKGYNSALLAYGQTGSGKSYTVSGYGSNEGILPRFARALFEELNKKANPLNGQSTAAATTAPEEADISNQEPKEIPYTNERDQDQVVKTEINNTNRYEVYFSMLEIYNEVVRDLLAKNHGDMVTQTTFARRGLKVREHPKQGFFVENLTSYACADKVEIERRIEEGQLNKSIAATSMNETSSRGHTIYEFKIKQYKSKSNESPEEILTTSVVQLVDLAGSERLAVHVTGELGGDSFIGGRSSTPFPSNEKSKSFRNTNRSAGLNSASSASSSTQPSTTSSVKPRTGLQPISGDHMKRFKESVSINQSLSALGNCIQVLSKYSQQLDSNNATKKSKPKIPYRDSVLTKLLNKCCLCGNSKVVIIATLSPADMNYDDTLSTLRFADRAKQIKTHAIINQLSKSEFVDTLQKENERLKQMVDGRVTRSDDSSQTSNFDDSENVMENFTGSRIHSKTSNNHETPSTPLRTRTTIRKSRDIERHKTTKKVDKRESGRLTSSSSNPSLLVKEQMKRLVSPASRKMTKENSDNGATMHKSRSMIHGLSRTDGFAGEGEVDDLDEVELNDIRNLDATNEDDLGDIVEGVISPDSDDSLTALTAEDLISEEKITMFNKMLSNSAVQPSSKESPPNQQGPLQRPKKANRLRGSLRQVSVLSSSLKKVNPYLSNLNLDEQLTGMISYIIKQGTNIVGKSSDCDIVLHGTELRGHHAKISRVKADKVVGKESEVAESENEFEVYIEPLFDDANRTDEDEKKVAIMVNGSPVTSKIRLNHCDRILFGTNAYFVFGDSINASKSATNTVADLDLVTFEMARNEVLRKVMAEEKNEAMIKEINDYTHRPGTGKHKIKSQDSRERGPKGQSARVSATQDTKLARTKTSNDSYLSKSNNDNSEADTEGHSSFTNNSTNLEETNKNVSLEHQEASYRDQLMEDTYEFALPVAEANAVAKEMGIKVTYGLNILTGEEQLPGQVSSTGSNSSTSERSSLVEEPKSNADQQGNSEDLITHLNKLDGLDVPPAVYIRVHLEDQDIDFFWSKEKFQARHYKILELYGAWDVGGKAGLVEYLIDQAKAQGDYLFDPFVDDLNSTPILIGHSQITLQPISHLTDVNQTYDILDLNDEILGTVSVQAIPCVGSDSNDRSSEMYRPYSDDDLKKNLLESPEDLLGRKLVFLLKIVSCRAIPAKYTGIYCQYSLCSDRSPVRTKVLRDESSDNYHSELDTEDLIFNHIHYICFDKVTQDIIDFLQHGFVTIQVVGHYRMPDNINRSPTVITTIINSINKYRFNIENRNPYSAMNYTSAYSNSNSDSARSGQGPTSAIMNSNSGASSVASTSATVNLFDQQNDEDEGNNSVNGLSQENIIDMILTKRKLDRAENQLHYLKRTVNIAEHYNKKHIPVKTVKKLLSAYGHELDSGSIEEMAADGKSDNL